MELWQIFIILSTAFSIIVMTLAIWLLLKLKEISIYYQKTEHWYNELRNLFRIPSEKGRFGELALEEFVSEHLPKEMYKIRERLNNGKTPDLQIILDEGILCIDSKFVFDDYAKYLETGDTLYLRSFRKNLLVQLEKIKRDYIDLSSGTLDFAIAYIPSESIYMFIIRNFWKDVIEYANKGVILASPLMLMELIRLLKLRILRFKLPEEIKSRMDDLMTLKKTFDIFLKEYGIMDKHLMDLLRKRDAVSERLRDLQKSIDGLLENIVP